MGYYILIVKVHAVSNTLDRASSDCNQAADDRPAISNGRMKAELNCLALHACAMQRRLARLVCSPQVADVLIIGRSELPVLHAVAQAALISSGSQRSRGPAWATPTWEPWCAIAHQASLHLARTSQPTVDPLLMLCR